VLTSTFGFGFDKEAIEVVVDGTRGGDRGEHVVSVSDEVVLPRPSALQETNGRAVPDALCIEIGDSPI
jgi:hypothetical protein